MFRPNLDGYHDASRDLWREVETRTLAALKRGENIADAALEDVEKFRDFQTEIRHIATAGIGGPLPDLAADQPDDNFYLTDIYYPSDAAGYRIEKLLITSREQTKIPVNLYVPSTPGPHPAVLFLSGHALEAKASAEYQEVCGLYAAAGFIVAAFDPLGQGERHSYIEKNSEIAPGTTEHTYAGIPFWWAGSSLARYFITDAIAVLNHLQSRTDVRAEQIIATGSSGGGMLTTLLMALEPRLAGAAPATYVTSRGAYITSGARQDAEQILLGATAAGADHEWLLLAMAPRPVCVLAAQWDFFPIEGTVKTCQRAGRAWELLGQPDNFQLVQVPAPHTYHRDLALAAIDFFAPKFDLKPTADLARYKPQILQPAQLQVTTSGQIATEYPQAVFGFEYLNQELAATKQVSEKPAREWLQKQVFQHRQPVPAQVRYLPDTDEWHAMWRNEENIWAGGVRRTAPGEPINHLVLPDTHIDDQIINNAPQESLILQVRGRGMLTPHDRDGLAPQNQASSTYRIMTDLLHLGDSLAAAQVWDVIRALDIFTSEPAHITGIGYGAYLARLAAFCDQRIAALTLVDEYVDPDAFITQREYDRGRGAWHGLIPGLVTHAPWTIIKSATANLVR